MFEIFLADTAKVVGEMQKARVEIRMQAPSVQDDGMYNAMRAARARGARAYVLLGPRAEYAVIDGRILMGKDPYPSTAQEFDRLASVKAEVFINPRFSEVGATGLQPGRQSHAAYVVVDATTGVICTGGFSTKSYQRQRNVCVRTDDNVVVKALAKLHDSEFDDTQEVAKRVDAEREAASVLSIAPGASDRIINLLRDARGPVHVRTSGIGPGSALFTVAASLGKKLTLTVPRSHAANPAALSALQDSGAKVVVSPFDFEGTVIATPSKVFVGSHRMTVESENSAREVGLIIGLEKLAENAVAEALK